MILLDIPEPKNCDTCIFCDSETGYCCLSTTDGTFFTAKNATKYIPGQIKPDWCPASKKLDKVYVVSEEYITKSQAMQAYCNHFCHPGPLCPDGYCKEVQDAFGTLKSVAFIIEEEENK